MACLYDTIQDLREKRVVEGVYDGKLNLGSHGAFNSISGFINQAVRVCDEHADQSGTIAAIFYFVDPPSETMDLEIRKVAVEILPDERTIIQEIVKDPGHWTEKINQSKSIQIG